eukprot:809227-Amphidinium_carterae.2
MERALGLQGPHGVLSTFKITTTEINLQLKKAIVRLSSFDNSQVVHVEKCIVPQSRFFATIMMISARLPMVTPGYCTYPTSFRYLVKERYEWVWRKLGLDVEH